MAASSQHLRNASELVLVAAIKDGFVRHDARLVSYATRLGQLLDMLFQGRRIATERDLLPGSGPLERLDTIFTTQWAIRQRPQRAELVVSAVFDGSWEAYCRNLQKNTGELLDAIFCHCEGYEEHTCVDGGYEKFSSWLRQRQVQTRFFHAATPDLTVADLRGLRRFAAGGVDLQTPIASVEQTEALILAAWPAPDTAAQRARAFEREHVLSGMAELAAAFSEQERVSPVRSARQAYLAAIGALLETSLDASLQQRAREKGLLPRAPREESKPAAPVAPLPAGDIQRGILRAPDDGRSPAEKILHGCLVLIQCDDAEASRRLLSRLLPKLAAEAEAGSGLQINLALSHAGMARLELGEEVLGLLPPEFREGMERRAGSIGDVGPHAHPSSWERLRQNWPVPSEQVVSLSDVDVVVLVQRFVPAVQCTSGDHRFDDQHPLYVDLQALTLDADGAHVLHVQALRRYEADHFELGEGQGVEGQPPTGQPRFPSPEAKGPPSRHDVPLGELLLGHTDRHGGEAEWARGERGAWLYANGTFLVVRKLQQDVAAFRSYLERSASELGVDARQVRGWLVGRYPDGRTLVAPDAPDPGDEFDYAGPGASACPLHAHARRVNPRLAATPRILRRSFPYGSRYDEGGADEERGLVFMAYGASLAEQFEVIARWVNGGNATGLPSFVNDVIAGVPQVAGADRGLPGGAHRLPSPERPFVAVRWGLYLFVPSLSALRRLASGSDPAAPAVLAAPVAGRGEAAADIDARGLQIISEIREIQDLERQRQAWKEVLEEQPDRLADARSVWAAIRHPALLMRLSRGASSDSQLLEGAAPGTLPTPYGWLVSRYEHAREIFGDDGTRFSVETYGVRFNQTIGGHYLGMDAHAADYRRRALDANAYLSAIDSRAVHETAHSATRSLLSSVNPERDPLQAIDLRTLALYAIGCVGREYLIRQLGEHSLDATNVRQIAEFVMPFVPVSRFSFQPYPDEPLRRQAEAAGQWLRSRETVTGPFADHLRQRGGVYVDDAEVRVAVIGAMVGFAPPALAHAVTTLVRWSSNGELQRHARKSPAARLRAVLGAMTEAPVPPTVYRKVLPGARLGDRELAPLHPFGSPYVVVGTQSVTLDARAPGGPPNADAWQWLFAGDRTDTSRPGETDSGLPSSHGCPARHAAVATLSGIIDAASDYPDARLCGPLGFIPGAPARR